MKMTDKFLALAKAASLAAISVFLPSGCGDEVQAPGDIVDDMNNAGTGVGQEVVVEEPRRAVVSSGGDVGTLVGADEDAVHQEGVLVFRLAEGCRLLVDVES